MKAAYPDKYSSLTSKNFFVVTKSIQAFTDGSVIASKNINVIYNAISGTVQVNMPSSQNIAGTGSANVTSYTLYYSTTPLP